MSRSMQCRSQEACEDPACIICTTLPPAEDSSLMAAVCQALPLSITANTHLWTEPQLQTSDLATGEVLNVNFWSEQSRVEQIVKRSNTRPSGKYPSWKTGRMQQWKSVEVLHLMRLLDFDPAITSFCEQPCEIDYSLNGDVRLHRPDLFVEVNLEKEIWDVIPASKVLECAARTVLVRKELARLGYIYRIVTELELAKQPRLQNVQVILWFGRRQASVCEREVVRRIVSREGYVTWGDAYQAAYGRIGRETLCRLVLEGALVFDLSQPLSSTTKFFGNGRSF